VGILQYVAPSLNLLLAVVVYHEPFEAAQKISFGLVWAGLLVYTISISRDRERYGHRS
jgi:chloramphenicol-sensitive protein RarD